MICIDCAWLAIQPLDMRAGPDTALARVVKVFGAAHPLHAYLFTNQRANRMKVLVHDVNSNLKRIQILNSQQLKTDTPG